MRVLFVDKIRRRRISARPWIICAALFLLVAVTGCTRQDNTTPVDDAENAQTLEILDRYPDDGDAIPTSSSMWVRFDGVLNAATVSADTVYIIDSNSTRIAVDIDCDALQGLVKITPAEHLDALSGFTIEVSSALASSDGRMTDGDMSWDFTTTAGADGISPHLEETSLSPVDGEINVSLSVVSMTVHEDHAVDPSTINGHTVSLLDDESSAVEAAIQFNHETGVLVLTPGSPLASGKTYSLAVEGIADMSGNVLDNPMTWSFTMADTGKPRVLTLSPTNADPLPVSCTISFIFDEDILPETVSDHTVILNDEMGNNVEGSVSYDIPGRLGTFIPRDELVSNMTYSFTLTSAISDSSGNTLESAVYHYRTGKAASQWTVMVYMGGDCDSAAGLDDELQDLCAAGLTGKGIRVIALADYRGSDNTYLYEILKGGMRRLASEGMGLTLSGGEVNTGSPETAGSFIDFVKDQYPAENYAMILWNHRSDRMASKILQSFESPGSADGSAPSRQLIIDENSANDTLTIGELRQCLNGRNIVILGMDSSGTATMDIAAGLYGTCRYMLLSQNRTVPDGWNYAGAIDTFMGLGGAERTPLALAMTLADGYIESADARGDSEMLDIAVIDSMAVPGVITAMNTWCAGLGSADMQNITAVRNGIRSFELNRYVDLYRFASDTASFAGNTGALVSALDSAILYRRERNCPADLHGVSIFFPVMGVYDPDYGGYPLSAEDFTSAGMWDNFLNSYYQSVNTHVIESIPNAAEGSENTDTVIAVFDSQGRYLAGDDDGGLNWLSRVRIPLAPGERYYIVCRDMWGRTGSYALAVSDDGGITSAGISEQDAGEPDNSPAMSASLVYGAALDLYLGAGDQDWVEFIVP